MDNELAIDHSREKLLDTTLKDTGSRRVLGEEIFATKAGIAGGNPVLYYSSVHTQTSSEAIRCGDVVVTKKGTVGIIKGIRVKNGVLEFMTIFPQGGVPYHLVLVLTKIKQIYKSLPGDNLFTDPHYYITTSLGPRYPDAFGSNLAKRINPFKTLECPEQKKRLIASDNKVNISTAEKISTEPPERSSTRIENELNLTRPIIPDLNDCSSPRVIDCNEPLTVIPLIAPTEALHFRNLDQSLPGSEHNERSPRTLPDDAVNRPETTSVNQCSHLDGNHPQNLPKLPEYYRKIRLPKGDGIVETTFPKVLLSHKDTLGKFEVRERQDRKAIIVLYPLGPRSKIVKTSDLNGQTLLSVTWVETINLQHVFPGYKELPLIFTNSINSTLSSTWNHIFPDSFSLRDIQGEDTKGDKWCCHVLLHSSLDPNHPKK